MQGSERVFYDPGCRRVWQVCSEVILNGELEDLLLGMPWLYANCLLVSEDGGVCWWVCGRLV